METSIWGSSARPIPSCGESNSYLMIVKCIALHGYFILPGDIKTSIEYKVEALRDGGSFSTRRVTAFQNGKAIFVLAASFQIQQEALDQHLRSFAAAAPEDLISDAELTQHNQ